MKLYVRIIFFILATAGLTGCASYSDIQFDELKPAGFSVPPEIKSVVLVDNSRKYIDTTAKIILIDRKKIQKDTVKTDYPETVLKSLKDELDKRYFFDTVYIDTVHYKQISQKDAIAKLTKRQVRYICNKFGADAVVSLDAYRYNNIVYLQETEDFTYYVLYDASAINLWRIYRCDDLSEMNLHIQKDTIFWDGYGASIKSAFALLPSLEKGSDEIAKYLSFKYADYLAPYWKTVTRRLYITGNIFFLNASDWVSKGNWEEAEKLWNYIYLNKSKKAKVKAALNLAVSMERKGDIDDAIRWAYAAYEILKEKKTTSNANLSNYAVNYYKRLTRRKREYKKLHEQVGGGF